MVRVLLGRLDVSSNRHSVLRCLGYALIAFAGCLSVGCSGAETADSESGSDALSKPAHRPLSYYEQMANRMIGHSDDPSATAQDVVARNALITSAYGQLYKSNPNAYRWAGLAQHTSMEVGLVLKATGTLIGMNHPALPGESASGVQTVPLTTLLSKESEDVVREIHDSFALGNLRLYQDAMPLFLAHAEGGIDEIEYLQSSGQLFYADGKPEANGLKLDWAKAIEAKDYQGAFVDFARFEQYYFLQDVLYVPYRKSVTLLGPTAYLCYTSSFPFDCNFFGTDRGVTHDLTDVEDRWAWVANFLAPSWGKFAPDEKTQGAWANDHRVSSQAPVICNCYAGEDARKCGGELMASPAKGGHPDNCVVPGPIAPNAVYYCRANRWRPVSPAESCEP